MATSSSISIVGEERLLTEALSIALRTCGMLATMISMDAGEPPDLMPSPEVLILASCGSYEWIRVHLSTARASFPQTKIILVGRSGDKDLPKYVLENAAKCLVTADSFKKLLRTLHIFLDRGSPIQFSIEPDLVGTPISDFLGSEPRLSELTIREQEIFRSISAGLSNKEIANIFSISTSTVKNHVHSILTKLHIRRRRYALGRTYVPRT